MPKLLSALPRTPVFCLLALVALALLLLSRPDRALYDFDGSFYVTVAYDLDRYGVFSDGLFAEDDSSREDDGSIEPPKPGMFFGPVFPFMVYAAMWVDPRFAQAVRCAVDADREERDDPTCEPYTRPIRLIDALLLALGATAVASAAALIFRQAGVFWLTGLIVLAALAAEADTLCLVMTESAIFGLYGLLAWATLRAWITDRAWLYAASGILLGILCLTKPSFLALFPVVAVLTLLYGYRIAKPRPQGMVRHLIVLTLALGCVLAAWAARNAVTVGKFALTEEYGSAALIERFAYDDMTAREFFQAFAYCTPGIGDLMFDQVYGTDSMHRFVYHTPGSFFHTGRDLRDALVEEHGRLDPLIGGIVVQEMRANWWRYLLVNIPLAWCGMWPGWIVSLPLVPLFVFACMRAVQRREPMFLLYCAPAVVMLGLHAAVGNHTTRYNFILIGPYAAAAAWLIWAAWQDGRWRWRSPAPAS
jgi:4-amino-4-deoxy-L-arabinose transferase-like glycosyltransferase